MNMIGHAKVGEASAMRPFERLLRGLTAWLATPFLLLAALAIGCWLRALGISRPPDG